jgi:uncharacterized membrane protein (UPF0127 family)
MPLCENRRNIAIDRAPQLQLAGRAVAIAVVAVSALLVGYTLYTLSIVPGTVTSPVPASFAVNGKTYAFTYIATTQAERQTGLMNKKVTNATTMLFAFPSYGAWQFWMYDTNTSLDMIWVDGSSGQVVYVVTSAPPCYDSSACAIYTPGAPANYVIEAKAGFAAANGIVVGTTINFG